MSLEVTMGKKKNTEPNIDEKLEEAIEEYIATEEEPKPVIEPSKEATKKTGPATL